MRKSETSLRSLRELQLVPPPADDKLFPSDPFSPSEIVYTLPEEDEEEGRDDTNNNRRAAVQSTTRDEMVIQVDNDNRVDPPLVITTTNPPRSQQSHPGVEAAYVSEYFNGSGSSRRRRSISRTPEKKKKSLMKVNTNGETNATRLSSSSRRMSRDRGRDTDIPILTKGRVSLHEKQIKKNDKSGSSTPPPKSSNGGSTTNNNKPKPKQKIFMIGNTKVFSRQLIPPTIYYNCTDNWIVEINNSTDEKKEGGSASEKESGKSSTILQSYSFQTEKEARTSAYANAPPQMIPFNQKDTCMLCPTKFTFFKRGRHCRNCGIVICSSYNCCTSTNKKYIPATYNIKNEKDVTVCNSCITISKRFKHALVNGRYGSAVELYMTGNINLRVPFMPSSNKKKGSSSEVMYPIHAAVEGKSEQLVRWLVDVHYCPLFASLPGNKNGGSMSVEGGVVEGVGSILASKLISSASGNKFTKDGKDNMITLKTSKGRSVIDIAMKTQHVGILRYLINEKNVSVYDVEDIELALGALEALVKAWPEDVESADDLNEDKEDGSSRQRDHGSGGSEGYYSEKNSKSSSKSSHTKQVRNSTRTSSSSPKKKEEKVYSHSIHRSQKKKERMFLPRDVHGKSVERHEGLGDVYDVELKESYSTDNDEDVRCNTIVLDDDDNISYICRADVSE